MDHVWWMNVTVHKFQEFSLEFPIFYRITRNLVTQVILYFLFDLLLLECSIISLHKIRLVSSLQQNHFLGWSNYPTSSRSFYSDVDIVPSDHFWLDVCPFESADCYGCILFQNILKSH